MKYTCIVEVRKDFGLMVETEVAKFKEIVNTYVWDLVKTMECLQLRSDNYPLLVQNTSAPLSKQKMVFRPITQAQHGILHYLIEKCCK